MVEKGTYLGTMKNRVLRYSDAVDHNVVQTILVKDLELEPKEDYFVEMYTHGGQGSGEYITDFVATRHADKNQINIPKDVVTSNKAIQPGRTVDIKFYECVGEEDTFGNSSQVLDRTQVIAASQKKDGCDSRLHSEDVARYLQENGPTALKFRNLRTSKECVAKSNSDYKGSSERFFFSKHARNMVDAAPGDLIEIIAEGCGVEDDVDAETGELIKEMHDMVSEMYDAYIDAKND